MGTLKKATTRNKKSPQAAVIPACGLLLRVVAFLSVLAVLLIEMRCYRRMHQRCDEKTVVIIQT